MKPKILVVAANYYEKITNTLRMHASNILDKKTKYKIVLVPGVFEIPVVIAKNIKKYDGFIALGCVIKGETPHFNFISSATTNAIMRLSIDYKKPIGNGIITCLNMEHALTRSSKKGQEAAKAVLSILGYEK
jgi:6,7-dimethyl-8-ribityllumazine synthase